MNTENHAQKIIRITLDDNNNLNVEATKLILPEAIQLCLAAVEALCKQTLDRADTPDLKQALEEDMYEMINMGASLLLNRLFPEITARPDLTIDAIMKAEDELLAKDAQKYISAYEETAQAKIDQVEHQQIKQNIKAMTTPPNRAQRRHPNKNNAKTKS